MKYTFSKKHILFGLICLFLAGCGDDEDGLGGVGDALVEAQVASGKEVTTDYHSAQVEADMALSYADQAMLTAGQGGRHSSVNTSYCAAFSHDKENQKIVLDFGTDGCAGQDGKTRKGIITINYLGNLDLMGLNERSITFTDYSVDGNILNGTLASTRWQLESGTTALESEATAVGMSLQFASDATTFSWSGAWKRKVTLSGADFANATYSITGGSTGKTRKDQEFVSTITSAITYKLACLQSGIPYAVQGERSVNVLATIPLQIKLNYGEGNCDKEVEISVNGNASTHTLP